MSIESLINKGCVVLNQSDELPEERTLVVLGTARGGTSIAAGSLYKLGVPMFNVHAPVYEEVNISSAFEQQDEQRYRRIINSFNEEPVWAWKRPSSIRYLDVVEKEIRNPFYIVVMRDALSVGSRNGLSMGHDVVSSMTSALEQQTILVDFVAKTKSPVLIASVEKIKQYPESFIKRLIEFAGISPEPEQIESAVSYIEPEPMDYIEASRINRSHGQIGGFNNGILFGWAAWTYRKEAVEVELSVNGEMKYITVANDWRDHGKGVPNKRDGYCGYKFDLNDMNLSVGDVISVRVKGEVRDLNNSPMVVNSEHIIRSSA